MDIKHLLIDIAVIVVVAATATNHDVISHFKRIRALITIFIIKLHLHLHDATTYVTAAAFPINTHLLQLVLHGQQLLLGHRDLVGRRQVVDLGRVL